MSQTPTVTEEEDKRSIEAEMEVRRYCLMALSLLNDAAKISATSDEWGLLNGVIDVRNRLVDFMPPERS